MAKSQVESRAAVGADEGLQRQVLGQPALADHVVDEAEDGPRIAVEDEAERLLVALPDARHQFLGAVHQGPGERARLTQLKSHLVDCQPLHRLTPPC